MRPSMLASISHILIISVQKAQQSKTESICVKRSYEGGGFALRPST